MKFRELIIAAALLAGYASNVQTPVSDVTLKETQKQDISSQRRYERVEFENFMADSNKFYSPGKNNFRYIELTIPNWDDRFSAAAYIRETRFGFYPDKVIDIVLKDKLKKIPTLEAVLPLGDSRKDFDINMAYKAASDINNALDPSFYREVKLRGEMCEGCGRFHLDSVVARETEITPNSFLSN